MQWTGDNSPLGALVPGREHASERARRGNITTPEEQRPRRQTAETERGDAAEHAVPPPPPPPPPSAGQELYRLLSSRGMLRRAVLLQEILGPPVALRAGDTPAAPVHATPPGMRV